MPTLLLNAQKNFFLDYYFLNRVRLTYEVRMLLIECSLLRKKFLTNSLKSICFSSNSIYITIKQVLDWFEDSCTVFCSNEYLKLANNDNLCHVKVN